MAGECAAYQGSETRLNERPSRRVSTVWHLLGQCRRCAWPMMLKFLGLTTVAQQTSRRSLVAESSIVENPSYVLDVFLHDRTTNLGNCDS